MHQVSLTADKNALRLIGRHIFALLVLVISQFALVQLMQWLGHRFNWPEATRQTTQLAASSLAMFCLALVVLVVWPQSVSLEPRQLRRVPAATWGLTAMLVVPLAVFSAGVQSTVAHFYPDPMVVGRTYVPSLTLVICLAVLPAVSEEIVFRGWIGGEQQRAFGRWRALGVTSVFFALVHVFPARIAATLVLGAGLHVVVLTSGSLLLAVFVHLLTNSLALFVGTQVQSPVPLRLALVGAGATLVLIWTLHRQARQPLSPLAWVASGLWLTAVLIDGLRWLGGS